MALKHPWVSSRPLCCEDETRNFHCGSDEVDEWFRTNAWHAAQAHQCSTHVCLDEVGRVIAFYSFKFVTVRASDMPSKGMAKGFDANANGTVLLLCWMGLASDYQHQGLGNVLFREIMEMARAAYVIAPFQLMVVDAIPGMEGFYKSKGFTHALKPEFRYVIRMNRVVKILEQMELEDSAR